MKADMWDKPGVGAAESLQGGLGEACLLSLEAYSEGTEQTKKVF